MKSNIQRNFQICISVALNKRKIGVDLTYQLKILSKDLMGALLKEKMHRDAIEFRGNLLKHCDGYILDIAHYFQIERMRMQYFNSCSVISGYTLLGQYYLNIAVSNSKAALTLEGLLYNMFLSSVNQCSERCESCNSIDTLEVMVCRNASSILVIHLS